MHSQPRDAPPPAIRGRSLRTAAARHRHPLLPYVDWASCAPALERSGRVLVGRLPRCGRGPGARGLVPTHGIAAALEMARGVAGGRRAGVLVAPLDAALVVTADTSPGGLG